MRSDKSIAIYISIKKDCRIPYIWIIFIANAFKSDSENNITRKWRTFYYQTPHASLGYSGIKVTVPSMSKAIRLVRSKQVAAQSLVTDRSSVV